MQSRLRSSGVKSAALFVSGSRQSVAEKDKKSSLESYPVTSTPKRPLTGRTNGVTRLADSVKAESSLLRPQTGPLPVYKLPLREEPVGPAGCRWFSFGEESFKRNRTVVLLGAAGSGKSTLIDGMINHILGVEREDSYRFTLVGEHRSRSRAEGQTSEVTVYKINHQQGFKIDHSLTIVDSPGFGDTRSAEEDEEISEHLCDLFSAELGVGEVAAVCLVVQAALARLTPSQIFVFRSVLSIFAKDVAENIRVLVTFADGQRPPVLEAINASGVPCPKTTDGLPLHFKFNNSALFAHNTPSAPDGGFDEMFWDMAAESMKRFFDAVSVTQTRSLKMTKEVLRERQQLQSTVEDLEKKFRAGLAKLQEIKQSARRLEELRVGRNNRFEFESSTKESFEVEISGAGNYFRSCLRCRTTCHRHCRVSDRQDGAQCWAIGPTGRCTQCPGRCRWTEHVSHKYKSESVEVQKRRSGEGLRAKEAAESEMDEQTEEYDAIQAEVERLTERCNNSLNRLEEIALTPGPLSRPDHIDTRAEFMAKVRRGEIYLPVRCRYQHPLKSKAGRDSAATDAKTNAKRPRLGAEAETRPDGNDETQEQQ